MKTLKKIYYVPGLFSAIFIPLVFWYLGNQIVHKPFTVVDLGIPAKYNPNVSLNKQYTFESFRNYNYQKIIVKPNSVIRNQKFYISELKKLQKRNKKETGIEFIIGSENTLQDLISLIDVMTLAKQDRYGIDLEKTGHFFAVHFYKDPKKIVYGYDVISNDTLQYYKASDYYKGFAKFKFQLTQLPRQAYYILFGFLIFLNISMLSIKDSFQIR